MRVYRSVKCASGAWGTESVPDKLLKNLKDLPEGEGNYYLAYYEGKHRQMPPLGRFADAAKQTSGKWIKTCSILTTIANAVPSAVHD